MNSEIDVASDASERRNFFRVDDSISMSYQKIRVDEIDMRFENSEIDCNFSVMSNIAYINQNMAGIMHRIEEVDQDVAAYLKAINNKIDILGRALLSCDSNLSEHPAQPVNLSASGLAFYTPEPIEKGSVLELRLMLMPSFTGIITIAKVVGCDQVLDPVDNYDHFTRVSFERMRENDRDLLIRHVIKRQSELLRKRREANE